MMQEATDRGMSSVTGWTCLGEVSHGCNDTLKRKTPCNILDLLIATSELNQVMLWNLERRVKGKENSNDILTNILLA